MDYDAMFIKARNIIRLFSNTITTFRSNGYVIPSGKKQGKGINQTLLGDLHYIFLSRSAYPSSLLSAEMNNQIAKIDAKAFTERCSCGNFATCFVNTGFKRPLIFRCAACQYPVSDALTPQWSIGTSLNDLEFIFSGTYAQVRNQINKAARRIVHAKGYIGNNTFNKTNKFNP